MKKLLFGILILVFASTLSIAQMRVGLVGGGQLASLPYKTPYYTFDGPNTLAFHAGLIADIAVSRHWSIRPQLLYSGKGGQYALNGNPEIGPVVERSHKINYLEVPVQLAYSLKVGPGRALVGAGPYIGYALSGKDNIILDGQGSPTDIEFGSETNQTRRIDYGLRVSTGYDLTSGLGLSFFYARGLANIENSRSYISKNKVYGVSMHFLFGHK